MRVTDRKPIAKPKMQLSKKTFTSFKKHYFSTDMRETKKSYGENGYV